MSTKDLLPPGTYRVRVEDVEAKVSEAGMRYWSMVVTVLDPPFEGYKLTGGVSAKNDLTRAVYEDAFEHPTDAKGKDYLATVDHVTWQNVDSARIRKFMVLDGNSPVQVVVSAGGHEYKFVQTPDKPFTWNYYCDDTHISEVDGAHVLWQLGLTVTRGTQNGQQ